MHLAPGSPTDMQTSLNPLVNEAYREKLNALYGLDKPIFIQYYDWLSRLVQFDFGNSLSGNGRPVLDAILERLPLTVGLNVTSLLLALFFAFPIGIISAVHQGKFIDKFFTFLVFLGFAMPGFWLALLLMLYLGIEHNLVPLSGITSLDFDTLSFTEKCLDVIHHLFLPVLVSTVGALAGTSRFLRSSMLEVLRQDYILTAKAKGLTKNIIIYKHALRNALLPVITLLGLSIPGLIGGSVIIESILRFPDLDNYFTMRSWQGIIRLLWEIWFSELCLRSREICLLISVTNWLTRGFHLKQEINMLVPIKKHFLFFLGTGIVFMHGIFCCIRPLFNTLFPDGTECRHDAASSKFFARAWNGRGRKGYFHKAFIWGEGFIMGRLYRCGHFFRHRHSSRTYFRILWRNY